MPTRTDYDVWWCPRCKTEWTVASLPHNPKCPTCGRGGWFRRFVEGAAYEVTYAND